MWRHRRRPVAFLPTCLREVATSPILLIHRSKAWEGFLLRRSREHMAESVEVHRVSLLQAWVVLPITWAAEAWAVVEWEGSPVVWAAFSVGWAAAAAVAWVECLVVCQPVAALFFRGLGVWVGGVVAAFLLVSAWVEAEVVDFLLALAAGAAARAAGAPRLQLSGTRLNRELK